MRRALVALGAGLLVALSLPPWGWWPLSFVGVAVFDAVADGQPRRWRFALGSAFGLGWLATGMMWMWQLTVPGYIAASVIFAAWHGAAELVVPSGRAALVGRPAAHALVEAWRLSFPFGGVPLATLGIAQVGGPFAGIARVGGVILLTWFVLQVSVAMRRMITSPRRWGLVDRPATIALGAAVVVLLVALIAPDGHGTGRFVEVVAVQGGGEQGTRALDVPTRVVTERHIEATQTIESDPSIDVVVWPENVVDTDDFATSDQLVAITDEAARLGVPIAVGVTADVPDRPGIVTNAQIVVTPDGEQFSRYDKVRRVPFGEYVPLHGLLEALGAPVDQVPTNAVAGTEPAVIDLPDGTRFGVIISWEVFFGGRAREGVKHGAEVLMNPTNGASYTGTIVQTQQVASSRLRAIETGRWLVQAAPTGFSEFVSPGGEVISRTAVGEQAVIRHRMELRTGRTWYITLGDRPWIAMLLLALAAAWLLRPSISRRWSM
ncbi:MAG: apolipoprotein N-acyltransferase [Desertimonas sp.]